MDQPLFAVTLRLRTGVETTTKVRARHAANAVDVALQRDHLTELDLADWADPAAYATRTGT